VASTSEVEQNRCPDAYLTLSVVVGSALGVGLVVARCIIYPAVIRHLH